MRSTNWVPVSCGFCWILWNSRLIVGVVAVTYSLSNVVRRWEFLDLKHPFCIWNRKKMPWTNMTSHNDPFCPISLTKNPINVAEQHSVEFRQVDRHHSLEILVALDFPRKPWKRPWEILGSSDMLWRGLSSQTNYQDQSREILYLIL